MTIKFSIIESMISNSCFLILLLTTIYYWIKVIFFSPTSNLKLTNDSIDLNWKFIQNLQNSSISSRIFSFHFGFSALFITNVLLTIQLIGRWLESGHFPLSDLYESLIFLNWGIITLYLIIEYWLNSELIGIFISPILLFIIGFTDFTLPSELQQNKPLVPALQSNWLFMHVSVMMLSYAALLLGCLIAIGYLIIFTLIKMQTSNEILLTTNIGKNTRLNVNQKLSFFLNKQIKALNQNPTNFGNSRNSSLIENISIVSSNLLEKEENLVTGQFKNKKETLNPTGQTLTKSFEIDDFAQISKDFQYTNLLDLFDNLSFRTIGFGFAFFTLGILSGAVWANETWGSYWSWDPKETWALITWLTFAVYLHTRFLKGWKGVKPAIIATLGFFIIWICYLGVNLLGKGLHSYGFLTS